MDPNSLSVMQGAAGAGGDKVYVEEVFSTYVYKGDEQPDRLIPNGLDLDGEGGMVLIKCRENSYHYALFDTERGENEWLSTNGSVESTTVTQHVVDFNSNGFTIGTNDRVNRITDGDYVSWSFRKAPGFFDVVTYTGDTDGSSTQTVSHNLECKPGMILIKNLDEDQYWAVYHKSMGATHYARLNDGLEFYENSGFWDDTEPTSTQFTVGVTAAVNQLGKNFVAYLFADGDDADAQIFGDGGNESIIKCGSFTGASYTESLGFEPQWLLVKRSDSTGNWFLVDNMRGFYNKTEAGVDVDAVNLRPNMDINENSGSFHITSDGFYYSSSGGIDYVYMAIRRGPMKTPEDATEVFGVDHLTNGSTPGFKPGFPVDWGIFKALTGTSDWQAWDRVRGEYDLRFNKIDDEDGNNNFIGDNMTGFYDYSTADSTYIGYSFRRAPGFFDISCFSSASTNAAGLDINHNLGVVPEMMIIKNRTYDGNWETYHKGIGNTHVLKINNDALAEDAASAWNDTTPTNSVFTVGTNITDNTNDWIAYLFATVAGVSKVGSETVGSSAIEVNCGFIAGARFVLIKRTDAAGDWYVYDSTRGINTSNDEFLLINEPDDEDSNDYIDPFTTGFKINSSLPSGDYIYLAIA